MMRSSVLPIRSERQQQAIDSFRNQGIIKAAPRFGKIKVSIEIMRRDKAQKVLIAAPRTDIFESWKADFAKFGFSVDHKTTTFRSLEKELDGDYDFYIFDEIHEASRANLDVMKKIVEAKKKVLALSGTMTETTQKEIFYRADLAPCYEYSISQAVEEGILCDYTITVHQVPLSTDVDRRYKRKNGNWVSEKTKFNDFSYVLASQKGKAKWMMELKIIKLLQESKAKLEKTKQLLQQFQGERILVFCGLTEIADSLGIPSYHSKNKEKDLLLDFCVGGGQVDRMATVKMIQAGITINPIRYGIINYTSGSPEDCAQKLSRFLGFEYDTPGKKADLHMVSSTEKFELHRIATALQFFDISKITYV